MGICWSNKIKAETPPNTGVSSEYVSRDEGKDVSGSSGKASTASVPQTPRSEGEILQSPNLKRFTYSELKTATRNFRPDSVLGEGGFGSVFKGWIDEQTLMPSKAGFGIMIAVKKLNLEGFQGHKEWLAEINYLGQLSHPNLVKLIGFCLEDDHRLLVYEFMSRGSMENHLFRSECHSIFVILVAYKIYILPRQMLSKKLITWLVGGTYFQPLSWSLRMKIALDAAKGLAFLHNAEPKIIYRDFKTSNILLDSSYNAKLSDFGLARDGPTGDKSHVSTRVMGTYGYAAPEYLATGHLTPKSDVYSFGVVLLEMLSGKRAIDKNQPTGQHNLVDWAKPYLTNKRRIFHVLDTRLDGQYSLNQAQKAANLALQCIAAESWIRPDMHEIVTTLEQLQGSKTQKERHSSSYKSNSHRASRGSAGKGPKMATASSYPRPSASPLHT
ncbi:hypothetical protein SAY87_028424 [Trapa incisa]|uniref:non-specific serine/threonine protein kinase n=1 Tax=Trapa incisa TaxID=236973 RepID=A0AAN7QS12_9MYRT|nr:hypothetical protein SAY87_028424 [Trapa incisa]